MADKTLRALLLEDQPGDARLVREALPETPSRPVEVEWCQKLSQAQERLARGGIDVVIADLNLPDSMGLDTLRALRTENPDVAIVVLTGAGEEETVGARAVREGAQDYLVKDGLDGRLLRRALSYAVERQRLLTFRAEFLRNVNHELRTPLSSAYGFVRLLLDDMAGKLPAKQKKFLTIAVKNLDQLIAMVDDLTENSRGEQGQLIIEPKHCSLAAQIRETIEGLRLTAVERGVRLSFEESPLPEVFADPKRCRQILINLIGNALKFTPRDGTVSLRAAVDNRDPGFVRVAVSDTGPGIGPEETGLIFERLHREPAPALDGRRGLGLGLSISRKLVSAQGGRIWVESRPGRGSTFYFTVPVHAQSVPAAHPLDK